MFVNVLLVVQADGEAHTATRLDIDAVLLEVLPVKSRVASKFDARGIPPRAEPNDREEVLRWAEKMELIEYTSVCRPALHGM